VSTGPLRRARCIPVILRGEVKRLLLLSLIAVFLAAAGATSPATRPPALLTYSKAVQPTGLCLARADGSRRFRLTRGKDSHPSWSPRGSYVAFARQTEAGRSQILVADARGRVLRRFGTGYSIQPAWSPNGVRIAYSSGTRIVVANRAGQTLVEHSIPALAGGPTWSPNSRRLAFTIALAIDEGAGAPAQRGIYVMNADGTGRRLLVANASDPAWSPDGSKIAYVSYGSRVANGGFVTVANIDGSGARRLTTSLENESQPAWSPGGRQIAFMRGGEIIVAPSTGGAERVAVRDAVDPAWRSQTILPKARRAACL
jgi:Tol biopolymer transport system component